MTLGLKLAAIVLLAGLYVALGRLGLGLEAVSGFATLVWAPSGLALAALVRLGPGLWPGVFLGALITNLLTGAPPLVAVCIGVGNTAEAFLGMWLLARLPGFRHDLTRLRDVLALVSLSALAATTVGATVGTTTLALAGMVEQGMWSLTWRAWWIGDALGALVVTPPLLVWSAGRPRLTRAEVIEGAILLAAVTWLSFFLFWTVSARDVTAFAQPISVIPLMLWATLRFGPRGATTTTLIIAIIAVAGTVRGSGPFANDALYSALELLQAFVGEIAIAFLILGAVITERHSVDVERDQLLRRAEDAVHLRDETLAVVSHDLRNPLNAVSLTANSLAKHTSDLAVRRQAELIERAAARMTRLIQDLLDTAAIAVGRLAIVRALYDPRDLVLEAVETWRGPAAERGIQLVAACPPQGWRSRFDRERLLQVVSNLLSNAIRVTPDGQSVRVTTWVEDGETRISVHDKGAGIQADVAEQVFERYWRGSDQQGGGAGLGLYIARGIVRAHEGRLWHEADPSGGSVFVAAIPGVYPPRRLGT